MTDHLLEAARAALHLASDIDGLAAAVGHILDHLQQSSPEPDSLDESNHADRYDRDGDRWVWCNDCAAVEWETWWTDGDWDHRDHWSRYAGLARIAEINRAYGPLTFAPRPADTPTTAPQPNEAHGDADEPARPAETPTAPETCDVRERYFIGVMLTTAFTHSGSEARNDFDHWLDGIRAEVWEEGHRTGRQDERNACHCEAWNDDECGCGRYGNSTTPNPYRKDRA